MPSTYDVINPANESIVETVNLLSLEETDAVIAKAAKAFESWKNVAPGERARLLRAFSQVVTDHREELAQLEITNSGHTRGNALWEADNVANTLMYYAAAPERLFGRQIPVPGGIDVTFKEPLGVVGVIVPWNFPMPIAGWGFAPALAAVVADLPVGVGLKGGVARKLLKHRFGARIEPAGSFDVDVAVMLPDALAASAAAAGA